MVIRNLAQQLISEEFRLGKSSDTESRAAFRVCEKLRRSLTTYAGVAGFRSLLSRALKLANTEVPWLGGLQIDSDGRFQHSAQIEAQLGTDEAAQGGTALVAQLLGLLATFIGDALTLRLLYDVWPKAAFKDLKLGGK